MSRLQKSPPRVFFGWWSVLFIGVMSGLGHGFNTYGISLFFKPIAAELDLTRAATSWAPGIGRVEGGITSPLVGWLSDKFGPRWVVVAGMCIAGTGMILMNFITEVWHYYVAWGALIGLGLNIGLTVAADKKINDWFIHRRGLAQGIKFALVGLLGVVVVQVLTPLIEVQGWRHTCLLWGLIMFAGIPLAIWLVKPRRPEHYGLLPDGAAFDREGEGKNGDMVERGVAYASSFHETEFTYKQALRAGTYWLLLGCFSAHNIIASGFNLHAYPFLTDIGIEKVAASSMMGLMIFFTVPSRLFGGIIADRVAKNRLNFLLTAAFLFQVIGLGTYLLLQSVPAVYVMLACHGLSSGSITPLIILIMGRYFGRKSFGTILGTILACMAPLGLLAPVYYGRVYDVTGNYTIAFITALALAFIALIITLFVRAPGRPAGTTDEPEW